MGDMKDEFLKAPGLLKSVSTEEHNPGVLFCNFKGSKIKILVFNAHTHK